MKNKNSMKLSTYIFLNALYGFSGMLWYQSLIFTCLSDLSYEDSTLLCYTLLIVSILIGTLITLKKRRNWNSIFVNVILGLEIYSLFAYYQYFNVLIWISLVISAILIIIYAISIIRRKINFKHKKFICSNKNKKAYAIKLKFTHIFLGSRTILAICLSLLLIPFAAKTIFFIGDFEAQSTVEYSSEEEYTVSNYSETLMNLEESKWVNLSFQEKLDLLQILANIEANYLGISHELTVISMTLEEDLCGYYSDYRYLIVINTTHIESSSSYDVLNTLCHEAYHAYQHRQVQLYNQLDDDSKKLLMFSDASVYNEEFGINYISGTDDDDFWDYYTQLCEVNAREYAEESVLYYEYLIEIEYAENVGI